ncbi:MAG: 50S ribosomal protein L32e [Thermoplasmatota archaeon]
MARSTEEKDAREEVEEEAPKAKGTRKKIKPQLDKKTRQNLEKRSERRRVQPDFKRSEWFRYKRLGTKWRRPRGMSNKMRLKKGYRPNKVRIGYGKPSAVRGLHPSGFREVSVHNVDDLKGIDPKHQAGRIGATVGTRKRRDIIEAADSKGIRILNRGVL